MGFYKLENNEVMYGEIIFGPTYILINEDCEKYSYPIDGWYWFANADDAYTAFAVARSEESNNAIYP